MGCCASLLKCCVGADNDNPLLDNPQLGSGEADGEVCTPKNTSNPCKVDVNMNSGLLVGREYRRDRGRGVGSLWMLHVAQAFSRSSVSGTFATTCRRRL